MPGKPARTARPAWADDGRIAGPDDLRRILADVNAAGLGRDNTALATQLVQSADNAALTQPDIGRVLPAYPALAELLPWPGGIRRGATVAVVGSTSLLMALLAGALSQGSWGACVGMPDFGALAAAEIGVPLQRLALVSAPGPDWPTVVSALIDGVDVVAVAVAAPPGGDSATRALMNRARQKGCVLLATTSWPSCELTIELTSRKWIGLGEGHGRLRHQEMTLRAVGRGRAARPRTATVTMPAPAAQLVNPPPHAEPPVPPASLTLVAAADPWADLDPDPGPADPWVQLQHRVPRLDKPHHR